MESGYRLYSSLPQLEQEKNRAEIDLDALRHNYRYLLNLARENNPQVRFIAVVKAEAYGHGAPWCVSALLDEGCDFFAVSSVDEAVAVRQICDLRQKNADILILGYTPPSLTFQLVRYDIIQALLSEEYAQNLNCAAAAAGITVRAHIAVDTGMNRVGIPNHNEEECNDAVDSVARMERMSHLRIEGMFTHFSRADEEIGGEGDRSTDLQAERYQKLRGGLERRGLFIPFHHVCNSAAMVRRSQDRMDGVRVGILLYGVCPSDGFDLPLKPVLKLKTVISHLHDLLPGESVGYGGIYTAQSRRIIATVPIGYADGFLRAYSGASVTVKTAGGSAATAPIVGNICMDQCMIDVTDTGAQVGDEVTFFGEHPSQLSDYAKRAGIINYECLCLISSRVPRIYDTKKETVYES